MYSEYPSVTRSKPFILNFYFLHFCECMRAGIHRYTECRWRINRLLIEQYKLQWKCKEGWWYESNQHTVFHGVKKTEIINGKIWTKAVKRGVLTANVLYRFIECCFFNNFHTIYRMSRGNVPDFGRMFLKLNYTDITKKLNGYGDNGESILKAWQVLYTYWLPNTY
jgi:hypothetical protein